MLPAASACSASTWSSSTGPARSPRTARSNAGPRPGVPRPSATTTAKPWSANHWLVRCAPRAATHALGVRAAVGVHQHRQRRARLVPRRQQQRGAQRPLAGAVQGDPGLNAGRLGVRGDRPLDPARRRATVVTVPSASSVLPARRRSVPPASRPPCTPGSGVRHAQPVRRGPGPQRRSRPGRREALSSTVSPSTSSTARTCRVGGVTGSPSTSSRRAPPSSVIHSSAPRRGARRHAGDDVDPVPGRCPRARGWSRRWPGRPAARAARAGRGAAPRSSSSSAAQTDVRQVLVALGVPARRRPGCRRARRRRATTRRSACRRPGRRRPSGSRSGLRGVGDVPALHRGVVDPRDQQRRAVRRPPVAAHPVHLLGRDELGEPVGDRRCRSGAARAARRAVGEVVDVQRAAADVRDARAGRVRPRVDDAGRASRAAAAARRPRRGRRRRARPDSAKAATSPRAVGGVGDDRRPPARGRARAGPAPRAAGPRRCRPSSVRGVGDQALRAGGRGRASTGR